MDNTGSGMLSSINVALPMLMFFIGLPIGFIIVTKKCFFDRYTIPRIVVPFILSPSLSCFAARAITAEFTYSLDMDRLYTGFGIYTAILVAICSVQLLLYIKFVRPKNISFAVFLFLCCLTFSTFNDFIESFFTSVIGNDWVMWIVTLLIVVEAIVFYKLVICPLSAISRTKQERGLAVFVIIPAIAVTVKLALMMLRQAYEVPVVNALVVFGTLVQEEAVRTEENAAAYRDMYASFVIDSYSYYIASHALVILLIISFAVIVKNVTHINEIDRQNEEIKAAHDDIKQLSVEVMEALAHTIDAKDKYTNGHSVRVAKYSRMIAEKMGLDKETCENIYYMGLLHDIGKIGVPNEIINKPAKLTDEEYGIIKTHPGIGYSILSEIKRRPDLATGALWHQERYDGKGYPEHKTGNEIPLEARIIAVADTYDAMTSNRSYRSYLPQDTVRAEIDKCRGTQFDPEAAECMVMIIDEDKDYILHE